MMLLFLPELRSELAVVLASNQPLEPTSLGKPRSAAQLQRWAAPGVKHERDRP
jgi:hypothetical protein